MPNFKHLDGSSSFPHARNVNVYEYENEFDYSRFDYTQMKITICSVPWDMGEAHIGARTISGIGNVVYFGTKALRDAWFAAIPDNECYRFETKYKKLHRDQYIDVPLPFDIAATFNYVVVEYSLFANDNSPVMFEKSTGVRKWFWFIREVEMLSANTTRLHILDDAWQTWIYDVSISGMILERGHAPMFATDADTYLANPINNNEYLLTEDVNFSNADTVRHIDAIELNAGDMYACIACSSDATGTWGTKAAGTWKTPASAYYTRNGALSYNVFAVAASDLTTFLTNVESTSPQFKATVQGVFFASGDLITLGTSFTFCNVTCYPVSAKNRQTIELTELDKNQFGYSSNYADIAKLYTSPYAHIEICDENGETSIVRIEDTNGTLNANVALNLAFPFVSLDAFVTGIGKGSKSVTFKNITSHTFSISGNWYQVMKSWDVPTFAVVLESSKEYDFSSHFDRAQRVVEYTANYDNASAISTTMKANADASADTANTNTQTLTTMEKANADASADTANTNTQTLTTAEKSNADASADLITDNANLAITANSATANTSKNSMAGSASLTQQYNTSIAGIDNAITSGTATASIQAQEQQAAIGIATSASSAAVNSVSSIAGGDIPGGIAAAAQGVIGALSTYASSNVGIHLTSASANIAVTENDLKAAAANTKTSLDNIINGATLIDIATTQNTLTSGQAANSSATTKANATRSKTAQDTAAAATATTQKANATRSKTAQDTAAAATATTQKANAQRAYDTEIANAGRTRATAQSAIENDIKQAALKQPFVYGSFSYGDNATTKPTALFAQVVTQPTGAIEAAGDEFLRYGYMLDKQWDFNGNWNIGPYFTYWKLKDFWVTDLHVPDMYMDKLRFFLFGGVTVWRSPEYVGKKTVYENFND